MLELLFQVCQTNLTQVHHRTLNMHTSSSPAQWTLEDMVDMTGKIVIVTGGNSGDQLRCGL
jgi:hypothetical protein